MPRDASKLLGLRGGRISHHVFRDIPELLRPGDLLVLNETRVIAARIVGRREPTGGRAECLLLRPSATPRYDPHALVWRVLARPARKIRTGSRISFADLGDAEVLAELGDGIRELRFNLRVPMEEFLNSAGRLPLPPYIHADSPLAQERYQTIFAREPGSVAAPTASLHFTQEVFDRLRHAGIECARLVLDVGLGTFRPIQSERLDDHLMHAETYTIPEATARAIAEAKSQGRRVVASGTTVVRALEGCAAEHGRVQGGAGETSIFITPGFRFNVVDALITNFHLPQSTLLALVCAFAGREPVLRAYAEAVACEYRFFSFGDAMYIEP